MKPEDFPEELAKEVNDRFSIMRAHIALKPVDDLIGSLNPPVKKVAESFRYNVAAAITTTGFPSMLAAFAAEDSSLRLYQVHALMLTPVWPTTGELPTSEAQEVLKSANEAFHKDWQESEEGLKHPQLLLMGKDAANLLLKLNASMPGASSELLRQGLVLVWGAFEVLCRDLFVSYLNHVPAAGLALVTDPTTKRLFPRGFEFEDLVQWNFDLSSHLGDLLSVGCDMGSCSTIKSVFLTLLPGDEALLSALSKSDIWMLSQKRHLIVHRRGVVDKRYREATGDDAELGSELTVTPGHFKAYVYAVRDVGSTLINSVSRRCSKGSE